MGHLKRSASGHLSRNAAGHLVNDCGVVVTCHRCNLVCLPSVIQLTVRDHTPKTGTGRDAEYAAAISTLQESSPHTLIHTGAYWSNTGGLGPGEGSDQWDIAVYCTSNKLEMRCIWYGVPGSSSGPNGYGPAEGGSPIADTLGAVVADEVSNADGTIEVSWDESLCGFMCVDGFCDCVKKSDHPGGTDCDKADDDDEGVNPACEGI